MISKHTFYRLFSMLSVVWFCMGFVPGRTDLKVYDEVYLDETGKMQLGDILLLPKNKFHPMGEEKSFGFSNANAWLKIDITAQNDLRQYLRFDKGSLNRVELFWPEGTAFTSHLAGSEIPPALRELSERKPTFRMDLPRGTTTCYIKVTTSFYLDVTFDMIDEHAYRDQPRENSFLSFVYGLITALTLFNFLFLVTSRMKVYRGYLYFGFTVLIYLASAHGNMDLYFPLPFFFTWTDICNSISGLAILAILEYERQILSSPQTMRRLDHLLKVGLAGVAFGMLTPIPAFRELAGAVGDISFLLSACLSLTMGFIGIKKRIPGIAYFMGGYGILGAAFVYYQLFLYHLVSYNEIADIFFEVGVSAQMVVMSLGLGNALQKVIKEKRQAILSEKFQSEKAANAHVLLKVLSHDLSNPLGVIIGTANHVMGKLNKEEPEFQLWERVSRAALHEIEIIDSTRRLIEIDTLQSQLEALPVDSQAIAEHIKLIFTEKFAAKNIHFTSNLAERNIAFTSDKTILFANVISNLISNAVKFTKLGGAIHLSLKEHGAEVILTLSDNGIGMPQVILDKINGGELETSSMKRRGTSGETGSGFGLLIVRRSVETLAGKMTVMSRESADGNLSSGTVITIVLPKMFTPCKKVA